MHGIIKVLVIAPIAAFSGIAAVALAGAMHSNRAALAEAPQAADHCGVGVMAAYSAAKDAITRFLVSPTSASFDWLPTGDDTGVYGLANDGANCRFRVESHVDAQNSYGATIRKHFAINLAYNPATGGWTAEGQPSFR